MDQPLPTRPTAVVTRARGDCAVLAARLRDHGFVVHLAPALEHVFFDDVWRACCARHPRPDKVLLASPRAAHVVSLGPPLPTTTHVVAVGPQTADAATERGLTVHEVSAIHTGVAAVETLAPRPSDVVLYPRARKTTAATLEALQATGACIVDPIVYENRTPATFSQDLLAGLPCDVLPLTSPSAARRIAGVLDREQRSRPPVVAIGPSTAAAASELGFLVEAIATPHTPDALADATAAWWRQDRR